VFASIIRIRAHNSKRGAAIFLALEQRDIILETRGIHLRVAPLSPRRDGKKKEEEEEEEEEEDGKESAHEKSPSA